AMGLAWNYYQAGLFADAEAAYRQAVEADPNDANAWCFLGLACPAQGKQAEAGGHHPAALRLRADFPGAPDNPGDPLVGQGRTAEAAECYERVLRLRPDYAQAHHNLGVALRSQGRAEEAAACYRRALQLSPQYADAHNNLGDALSALGEWDQ